MSMILQDRTLFISAGHSDTQPGAAAQGFTEADIVLEFRDLVANALRDRIVFGKDGIPGVNLPLNRAVKEAAHHDVAIEFHCNAGGGTGVETLSRPEHYPLGNALCQVVSDVLQIPNRGAKPEGSGHHSRLAFVSDGGGILLELFFLDSQRDLVAYQRNRQRLAEAVALVLINEVSRCKP